MRVLTTGKNTTLSEAIEHYADEKFGRLGRYQPKLDRVEVEITREATRDASGHVVCQANLIAGGRLILRGEVRAADERVAIDTLVDQLEARLERQHQLRESNRRANAHGSLPPAPEADPAEVATFEQLLDDYGVDEEVVDYLVASGIRTLEQLRAVVDDGRLVARLGPRYHRFAPEIVKAVERLH
jgi:putative sigma-54 modulation protein